MRQHELCGLQGVLNGVDDKPEGFDGNTDALLAAKAQAKQQLQTAYQLSVRFSDVCTIDHVVLLQNAHSCWKAVMQPCC